MTATPAVGAPTGVTVIGRCLVTGPAGERVIAGRRARIACVALAFSDRGAVSRDELAFALWGDDLPASWAPSLREVLADLRADLTAVGLDGARTLVREGGGYRLRLPAEASVDFHRAMAGLAEAEAAFAARRSEAALASAAGARTLADGSLLPEEEGEWIDAKRVDLGRLAARALEIEAASALDAGRPELAVRPAMRLVALEPFRDSAVRLAMRAHDAAGDRAAALRVYYAHRDALDEELGLQPSAAAQAAFIALLNNDRAPAEVLPGPLAAAVAAPLVGEEPLAALAAAWERGDGGPVSAVLVTGEAGSGKTRAVAELAARCADAGTTVLYGRCDELPLAPYQPFAEALDTWAAVAHADALAVAVAGAGPELARLVPRLAVRVPREPVEAAPDRLRLFAAVVDLIAGLAARGRLLIVLDDLHWSDSDTALLLRHVARAGSRLPGTLLALTTRPPGDAVIAGLERELRVDRVALQPLSLEQLEELATALGAAPGDAAGAARYARAAGGGNALLATELIRTRLATGNGALPPAVAALVAHRLAGLSSAARRVLGFAAVAQGIDLALLREASSVPDAQLATALEEATSVGLLTREPSAVRYRPAHPVLGAAIADGLGGAARAELHAALASALAAAAPADAMTLGALAHHLAASGSEQQAAEAAHAAAVAAIDELSYGQAVRWERMALERCGPAQPRLRLEILLGLGRALKLSGDLTEADVTFDDALALARRLADVTVFARAVLAYAEHAGLHFDITPRSRTLVDEALAALPPEQDALRDALGEHRVRMLALDGRPGAAAGATELEERGSARAALRARVHALAGPGDADERLLAAGRLAAASDGDVESAMVALEHRAFALLERGDATAALAAQDEYIRAAAELGRPQESWTAASMAVMRATVDTLGASLDAVEAVGIKVAGPFVAAAARNFAAEPHLWLLGRCAEIQEAMSSASDAMPHLHELMHTHVFFAAETGRSDVAGERLGAAVERLAEQAPAATMFWSTGAFHLASTAVELGMRDEAEVLHALLAPHARRNCVYTAVIFFGAYELHLGSLAAVLGRYEEARTRLLQALDRHEAMRAAPWAALTRGRLAAVLERLGDPRADELRARAEREASTFALRPLPAPLRGS